jgi:hypothetical protein
VDIELTDVQAHIPVDMRFDVVNGNENEMVVVVGLKVYRTVVGEAVVEGYRLLL